MKCERLVEAAGPHEGCAEFVAVPDVFQCGGEATVKVTTRDKAYEAATGDQAELVELLCAEHAEELCEQAESAAHRDWLTVVSTVAV